MRLLIFIVIGLLGLPVMPPLIRTAFPALPTAMEEVPVPFYWVQESGVDSGPVLVQYYAPPLRHEVVLGDTNFMVPPTWPERAYRGSVDGLVPGGSRIVGLELEELGGEMFRLSVQWDDIGPSGATFWYREREGKVEPVWAAYAGMSLVPLLGGTAWCVMGLGWLGLMVVTGIVWQRRG